MIPNKTMIICRGLPGSGKSTLASILASDYYSRGTEYTVSVRSTDTLFVDNDGTYKFNPSLLHYNHTRNQTLVKEDCENGTSLVIIDNTNTTWNEIKPYIEIAKHYGYYVSIQEPTTGWAFDVDICTSKNTHGVPKEAIQRMKNRWEDSASIAQKLTQFYPQP